MKKYSVLAVFVIFFVLASYGVRSVSANEGFVELRNTVGEDARCHVTSGIMQDLQYNVLVLCRDITYPGGTDIFNYIVWTTPTSGGVQKLGEIALGKVLFKTKNEFTSIFVTKERDKDTREPKGQVVMQGSLQQITFLDGSNRVQNQPELGQPETSPSPIPTAQPQSVVSRLLAAGGVIAFIALFGVLLLVFVVTRK
ncbi:hypothetical protein C4564_04605 [Candidatus Microgenomates bacterium]|nr:MAG: hypothetical protein C4564_04605 [Candidatus Microgenomates bacterium]